MKFDLISLSHISCAFFSEVHAALKLFAKPKNCFSWNMKNPKNFTFYISQWSWRGMRVGGEVTTIKRKSFRRNEERFHFTKAKRIPNNNKPLEWKTFFESFPKNKNFSRSTTEEKCKTFLFPSTCRTRKKSGNKNSFRKISLSMTLEKFSYPLLLVWLVRCSSSTEWEETRWKVFPKSLFSLFFSLCIVTSRFAIKSSHIE